MVHELKAVQVKGLSGSRKIRNWFVEKAYGV
jgi:hypothetical protein